MGAIRFWSRLFSYRKYREMSGTHDRAIIVGIGGDAVRLARHRSAVLGAIFVVGFVDPNPHARDTGRRLAGLPVLGHVPDIANLVAELDVDQVIIATSGGDLLARRLVDLCMTCEVRLRILPDIDTVLQDDSGTGDIRDLELTDLLPRQRVETDLTAVAELVAGHTVLVTGAGGSIGSELVRQLLEFNPAHVVAVDHDETHLHDSAVVWGMTSSDRVIVELADIRDAARVRRVFEKHRPAIVFHAAAHKQVHILVLISTDKAVDPTSVMGASKRMAEMLVQASRSRGDGPKMAAVRFGNVLGSRGSVVPTFARQIASGGPVTVSHADMERYFMTVDEAVQLVLQSVTLSDGGEVFVLDMGEPVRILDLAHRMIRLSGLVPGKDIAIEFTGQRPGEKLTETLSIEPLEATTHEKILTANPSFPGPATILTAVEQAGQLASEENEQELAELLLALTTAGWTAREVIDLREDADMPVLHSGDL
jgi:FlaA1/EpsC-like NDP-sugar epimerase